MNSIIRSASRGRHPIILGQTLLKLEHKAFEFYTVYDMSKVISFFFSCYCFWFWHGSFGCFHLLYDDKSVSLNQLVHIKRQKIELA